MWYLAIFMTPHYDLKQQEKQWRFGGWAWRGGGGVTNILAYIWEGGCRVFFKRDWLGWRGGSSKSLPTTWKCNPPPPPPSPPPHLVINDSSLYLSSLIRTHTSMFMVFSKIWPGFVWMDNKNNPLFHSKIWLHSNPVLHLNTPLHRLHSALKNSFQEEMACGLIYL